MDDRPATLPLKSALKLAGSSVHNVLCLGQYTDMVLSFLRSQFGPALIDGEFCLDGGFGVAFEKADNLG
jgi:hypothetical protein